MQTLAALLTPTIAVAAAVIGYLQWRTAHQRVMLDLFDRRMTVYEKLRRSMSLINTSGKVSDESNRLLLEAEGEAAFVFGQDIQEYLRELWVICVQAGTLAPDNGYQGDEQSARRLKLLRTVSDFYNKGPDRFAPYMRMDQKRLQTPIEYLLERNKIRKSYGDHPQQR
ncbi:ABC transporter ATP-binding protein [Rhizobium sp. LC145]|uniref:ABC transporter ATP-binding protein n=1 Tax=Rhizobium sp. LC145 TaxID=1120688 RepID=UPI0010C9BF74|nr:ABC transporter ATP-binding protein [Rhizobium sp. LC145]TKT45687.1 ABC transporter ATP-binding protein [Rhizobiaceae bacterium LC148]